MDARAQFKKELNGWLSDLGEKEVSIDHAARLFEFGSTPKDSARLLQEERLADIARALPGRNPASAHEPKDAYEAV